MSTIEDSILKTIKKMSGVLVDDDSFDIDVITQINTVFVELNDLGIGPEDGFMIESDTETWATYFEDDVNLNNVKTFMALKVRLAFDLPTTSYHIEAIERQIDKLEWRIVNRKERSTWTPPTPPVVVVLP